VPERYSRRQLFANADIAASRTKGVALENLRRIYMITVGY